MTHPATRSSHKPRTVLLSSPHQLVREGIACLLQVGSLEVVGKAQSVRELRHLATQQPADVFLLAGEPDYYGADVIRSLKEDFSRAAIAVLRQPQSAEGVMADMQAGARGCLSVNLSPEEFISSMQMIANGDVIVSRDMTGRLAQSLSSVKQEEPALGSLSDRERQVLTLVAQGATNREIASTLIITENTVKVHLRNILDKLDLRNRQQAAAFAAQEGLVLEQSSEESA